MKSPELILSNQKSESFIEKEFIINTKV